MYLTEMNGYKRGKSMERFLNSNETVYRLARTIVQGILGVLVANIDYFVGMTSFSTQTRAIIVAVVMAVLSPIMAELGKQIQFAENRPPNYDGMAEIEGDEDIEPTEDPDENWDEEEEENADE